MSVGNELILNVVAVLITWSECEKLLMQWAVGLYSNDSVIFYFIYLRREQKPPAEEKRNKETEDKVKIPGVSFPTFFTLFPPAR